MKTIRGLLKFLIILNIIIGISVWVVFYPYLSKRMNNSTRQVFVDQTISYLSSDQTFINKYGTLVVAASPDYQPIKNESFEQTQYYMDFICITERGQCTIRVYHTWVEHWTYEFEEIEMN